MDASTYRGKEAVQALVLEKALAGIATVEGHGAEEYSELT